MRQSMITLPRITDDHPTIKSPVTDSANDVDAFGRIQADRSHMEIGQTIFVRGKQATIVDVDFPTVFWRLEGESVVRHRNFLYSRKIFRVLQGTQSFGTRKRSAAESSVMEFSDDDHEDFVVDESKFSAEFAEEFEADFDGQSADTPGPQDIEPTPSSAAGNIFAALSKSRNLVQNVKGLTGTEEKKEELEVNARAPESVYISSCSYAVIRVPAKVTNLVLEASDRICLKVSSVIAKLDVFHTKHSQIEISESCGSVILEDLSNSTIEFPSTFAFSSVVTKCESVVFKAMGSGSYVDLTLESEIDSLLAADPSMDRTVPVILKWDPVERNFKSSFVQRDSSNFITNL